MTKKRRRDQILRHAKAVFARKGYHEASISDIVSRARIARGTFYLHFLSKREVFGAILDTLLKELDDCVRPVKLGKGEPSPVEQVKANVSRALELILSDSDYLRIVLRHAATVDKDAEQAVEGLHARIRTMIAGSLVLGIRMGLIRPCNADVVAACVLGAVKEVVEGLARRGAENVDPDAIAEEIVQFGLRGVAASSLAGRGLA